MTKENIEVPDDITEFLSHSNNVTTSFMVKWNSKCPYCLSRWFSNSAAHENHSQCLGHTPDQRNQVGARFSRQFQCAANFENQQFKLLLVECSVSGRKKKNCMWYSFWLKTFIFSQIKLISKMVKRSEPVCFLISFGSSICKTFITLQLISTNTWMTGWDEFTVAVWC